MSSMLLVGNPAKRRKTRRHFSAAQIANQKRFAAAARARRKPRSNPVKARRRRVTRSSAPTSRVTVMANPARRHHHRGYRRRHNPDGRGLMRYAMQHLKEAAGMAAGAVGVDMVFGFLKSYLPDTITSPNNADGTVNYSYLLAKFAAAVGTGLAVKKFGKERMAASVVTGSMTVELHRVLAPLIGGAVPSFPLGSYIPGNYATRLNVPSPNGMLGAYTPGVGMSSSQMLGRAPTMRAREGIAY